MKVKTAKFLTNYWNEIHQKLKYLDVNKFENLKKKIFSLNKKNKIIGLIAHTSKLCDIIKLSYSYKTKIVQEICIDFDVPGDNSKRKFYIKKNFLNIFVCMFSSILVLLLL